MDLYDIKTIMICSLLVFILELFRTIGMAIYLFHIGWGFAPVFGSTIFPSIIILIVLTVVFGVCQSHVWNLANKR